MGWLALLLLAAPPQPSCGVTAAVALAHCLGRPIAVSAVERLAGQYPEPSMSLLEVRQAAAGLGVDLVAVRATLDEVAATASPAILHLGAPDHFVAVLSITDRVVHCVEQPGGRPMLVPTPALRKRYTGAALLLPARPAAAPRAEVAQVHWDFEAREAGQEWAFNVPVRNAGGGPLTISLGGSSCTCTSSLQGNLTVAPGGSALVPVQFRLTALRPVEQAVWLATDDPSRPIIGVSVAAHCEVPLRAAPDRLTVVGDRQKATTARVVVSGPLPVDLTAAEVDSEYVEVRLRERTERPPYLYQQVELELQPGLPSGEHRATLALRFGADGLALRVPVTLIMRPLVVATPRRWAALDCATEVPFECHLTSPQPACGVRAVTTGSPAIREVARRFDAVQQSWHLSFLASLRPGQAVAAEILVTTDLPGEPPVRIPVTLRAAEPPA